MVLEYVNIEDMLGLLHWVLGAAPFAAVALAIGTLVNHVFFRKRAPAPGVLQERLFCADYGPPASLAIGPGEASEFVAPTRPKFAPATALRYPVAERISEPTGNSVRPAQAIPLVLPRPLPRPRQRIAAVPSMSSAELVPPEDRKMRDMPPRPIESSLHDGHMALSKERDACGVGFVVSSKVAPTGDRSCVEAGLAALGCMEHRGACGGDGISGDGAGVMTTIPWQHPGFAQFVSDSCPQPGVGMMFMPRQSERRKAVMDLFDQVCKENDLTVLGWREVPVDDSQLGAAAYKTRPTFWQVFVKAPIRLKDDDEEDREAFERLLYLTRRRFDGERSIMGLDWGGEHLPGGSDVYFASFSSRTIVYKGMVQSSALQIFYKDLAHPMYTARFCIYHRRFSTNTNPRWPLAQPMRVLGHNGEINTLLGNLNWQKAREAARAMRGEGFDEAKSDTNAAVITSGISPGGINMVDPQVSEDLVAWNRPKVAGLDPIVSTDRSDSANLDSVFDQMCKARHRVACALMTLVPAAYRDNPVYTDTPEIVDFYEYHSSLLEAWDGPALLVFSDGKTVGAALDRNGLRPARYTVESDGRVCLMSETGVVPGVDDGLVDRKGRLGPGDIITVDLDTGKVKTNLEVKQEIAKSYPYGDWIKANRISVGGLPFETERTMSDADVIFAQSSYGWGKEDVDMQISDMAGKGMETTYSMGDDAPLAVLSERSHVLYNYFKQRFAQVTNPPIDPLREGVVMSLRMTLGRKNTNIYLSSPENARTIKLESPILNQAEINQLRSLDKDGGFSSTTISTRYCLENCVTEAKAAIENLCDEAVKQVRGGAEILILSDKPESDKGLRNLRNSTYIPPLLAVGAVHHRLIKEGLRMDTGLVVETGAAWSTHHFACLYGFGAHAVHPYMAYETIQQWYGTKSIQGAIEKGSMGEDFDLEKAQGNFKKAIEKGLMKILSKIGISLLSSYHGAQIFEAIGLDDEVVDLAFVDTPSRVGGMSIEDIAAETTRMRPDDQIAKLANPGFYQPNRGGEYHANSVELAALLHKAIGMDKKINSKNRTGLENGGVGPPVVANYEIFKKSLEEAPLANLRDLMDFKSDREPIDIDAVEPAEEIMKRFCTGAMSLGALSREAHETLAIAMNRIGGKSNSGEGGEDIVRTQPIDNVVDGVSPTFPHLYGLQNGDSANSAVHQVASGRFGVTPEFLVTAKQLEIKIAQGAKPGEGGQLPGAKVSEYIAGLRASKKGVTLISPPPHHDIYSIEDLAQLVHDLHAINDEAPVSVKLVSCIGIGTVACGVAKADADVIQISGGDGGTGASPLSSIKHAGGPWELGLSETHSSLLQNGLRDKVLLRVDGGIRTGRDVMMAALLGSEEYGFGTIAMIAEGCVMARVCHKNSCPVGVTSQKEELRARFPGSPEHVVNFFGFVAQEVRELLAHMGYTRLQDVVGRSDLVAADPTMHSKVAKTVGLDVGRMLLGVQCSPDEACSLDPVWAKTRRTRNVTQLPVHANGASSELDRSLASRADMRRLIKSDEGTLKIVSKIRNTDRSVGSYVSGAIAREHGNFGLNGGHLELEFHGSAGQSFGAFNMPGVQTKVVGEANDYVGKSMHGGELVAVPMENVGFNKSDSSIIGNACLYGATGGHMSALGRAGERFSVRNSGCNAVIEGAGDHCCEYMTGGTVAVLGSVGRNVGAGMTGGIAYFLDDTDSLMSLLNMETISVQRVATEQGSEQLRALVQLHYDLTGSDKAKDLLVDWKESVKQFWQIYPAAEANTIFVREPEYEASRSESTRPASPVTA